jgi:hypothetical protein
MACYRVNFTFTFYSCDDSQVGSLIIGEIEAQEYQATSEVQTELVARLAGQKERKKERKRGQFCQTTR